ncbi:GIY-YIG nuclease family protein [Patescibacteria group bacterium]
MCFFYIIKSLKNGRYYYGSTNSLRRRISEHNSGKSKYTKQTSPYELVYYEEYTTPTEARQRERQIKKMKSRKYVDRLISRNANKSGPI